MTGEELVALAARGREGREAPGHRLSVCTGSGCLSAGGEGVRAALSAAAGAGCRVGIVGCRGLCADGPLVNVEPAGVLYRGVRPEDAPRIVTSLDGAPVAGLVRRTDDAFFTRQHKIVLERAGHVDPERIEDAIALGGYAALHHALTDLTPEAVVQEIVGSGLRGRGGAGYPTGLKWSTVAKSPGGRKFVICNADEGDPGAFMDRSVLESDPHRVLEGMAIAAFAVGASEGFIYVRAEYPLAVKRLRIAIRQAEGLGVLGHSIFGTPFAFRVEIRLGAGAFVCGEETALMASVEGRRGTPRPRPPFPAERGLWGCPTLINNVETLANIPPIIRHGGAAYAALGTGKSRGTKVFALAGKVVNTGLVEVPMGMTLREIVMEIGGGIPGGRALKAVQTGGPSGGCVPAALADVPVDYESLAGVGTIMGSGGMIVIDDTSCMVDVARYFLEFCMSESCGACVPCRAGTVQMHDLIVRITRGEAEPADLALLEELCELVRTTSLCGLGQTAPNAVVSTLRHFRDEYLAHILDRRCPAGVCPIARVPAGVAS